MTVNWKRFLIELMAMAVGSVPDGKGEEHQRVVSERLLLRVVSHRKKQKKKNIC